VLHALELADRPPELHSTFVFGCRVDAPLRDADRFAPASNTAATSHPLLRSNPVAGDHGRRDTVEIERRRGA
jgi:hypothetical protein